MRALHLINTAGNLIPHSGRRFILDSLGLGKLFKKLTAGSGESVTLPNGLQVHFNPLMHWNVTKPESHEPEVLEALKKYLKPGSVLYDIGANVGLHSLIASSIVGPTGKVLAFEPGEINLRHFRRSLEQPGASNVSLHPIAIGSADGNMIFDMKGGAMSGKVLGTGEKAVDPISVQVRSIDSLIAEGQPFPDVIKIDIEGSEGDALEGATETLKRRPVIICEMHTFAPDGVRRATTALERAGYEITKLNAVSPSGRTDGYHVLATKP